MKIKGTFTIKKKLEASEYILSQAPVSRTALELKIQELTTLLEQSVLNKDEVKMYQNRLSDAFHKAVIPKDPVRAFQVMREDNNLTREELLNDLEQLLVQTQINSNVSRIYLRRHVVQKILLCIISFVLIATGFAMIIMPAPPSFELFTVFYFNPNDGVTIMDLVSLLIILAGVFLFVLNFNRK